MITTGAVATPHHRATDAGLAALRTGGNAVDAALAAAAVLTVVYPHQCSIGGDAIALVGGPDGEAVVINGSGRAARVLDPADYDDHGAAPARGAKTVTVPGVLSAWQELTRRWGRRPLAAALEPAAELAAQGFAVSPGLRRELVAEQALLGCDPGARATFLAGGRLPEVGDTLRLPRLAASLTGLAADGVEAFYAGPLGASVVETLRAYGSDLTSGDLRDHRVAVEAPVSTSFRGSTYAASAGNTQGLFFLQGLAALDRLCSDTGRVLDPLGADAGLVARVLAASAARRDQLLGDDPLDPATVLAEDATRALSRSRTSSPAADRGDTVAIVAADADGTWVSLIQSLFGAFGSGILDPETGILLHNRGSAFSLDPAHPGRIGPSRRPPHTLMPVLVRDGAGQFVGAHGTMGGRAQPQVHTHVALALAQGLTPAEAVGRSRWVIGRLEGAGAEGASTVAAERDVPSAATEALVAEGFDVVRVGAREDLAGHAQLVRRVRAGLLAASDPRADGNPDPGVATPVP